MLKIGLVVLLSSSVLAGCNLPRGAALQSEIISTTSHQSGGKTIPDIEVVQINRTATMRLVQWPKLGVRESNWISRKKQPPSLLIAPGDMVEVTVWDTDENSLVTGPAQRSVSMNSMKVGTNGQVFLPFVGPIKLAGITPDMARQQIENAYLASIPSAQVQLNVSPGRGNTANLVSGVHSPGVYPLPDRDVTLLSLLAMGGGVHNTMINPHVRLMRNGTSHTIALSKLYEYPHFDTTLQGGDRVIVESDQRAFLALGSAGVQSRQIFPKDDVTALDALAIIGGLNATRANPKGILILRNYPVRYLDQAGVKGPRTNRVVFAIDLTNADGMFSAGEFEIMPDDVVYITESPVNAARTLFGVIGSVFGIANQIN